MSVRLVTGVPGSGKSYYLSNRCSVFDPISGLWELKPDYLLFASLDGLKLAHRDLVKLINEHGLETVFNVEFWEPFVREGRKIVVVLDEAQRFFSSNRRLPDSVWYFFEYHRHLGLEIWLMSQSASSINRRILAVTDSYIEAAPPSLRLGNIFRYRRRDTTTNEVISRESIRSDSRVFALYKSAVHSEGLKKPRSALLKFAVVGGGLIAAGLFSAPLVFSHFLPAKTHHTSKPVTSVSHNSSSYHFQPVANHSSWRSLVYRGISPGGSVPKLCKPFLSGYYRCGPLPMAVDGLPGAICNKQFCVLYVPVRSASLSRFSRSGSEERNERESQARPVTIHPRGI